MSDRPNIAPSPVVQQIMKFHIKGFRTTGDEVWNRSPICQGCDHSWPCDTAVLIEEIEKLNGN